MDEQQFQKVYASLNKEQREAVDAIDGPVLVVAGPGTGKTQLLSARVANILHNTDIQPQNILCLTFTESGAMNMRDRLSRFIGNAAYEVQIDTYHAFGGNIIKRYPEFFTEHRLQQPIDELGRHQIVHEIVAKMSYRNPLKQTQHHLQDLLSTMSEVKRALLTPADIEAIAKENLNYIASVNSELPEVFRNLKRIPGKYSTAAPYFESTLEILARRAPETPYHSKYGSLAGVALLSLKKALEDAEAENNSKSLTAWKNAWLAKNNDNQLILDGELKNRRFFALAAVLAAYSDALQARGLYDFDDMIIRAVHAIKNNNELRYTLHERYQYLLLDEFQDTNAAQIELVELLTNNPAAEGRPNVMAVGDDDQAIYAFQGAEYSNMLDFYRMYVDVKVINLHQNYRSHAAVLETAQNITGQMSERLFTHFPNIEKQLTAANGSNTSVSISREMFLSDVAERAYVAEEIAALIRNGTPPHEIAVLAPRHALLAQLVPYLNAHTIPVHYEKRENILEAPLIRRILTITKLIVALSKNDTATADACWAEVLSGPEWHIPVSAIWGIAWKVNDAPGTLSWGQALLESEGALRQAGLLYLGLAQKCNEETLEQMLDYIIGNETLETHETDFPLVTAPLRDYYVGMSPEAADAQLLYETLSQLTVLRSRLRDHQASREDALRLPDLLALVDAYRAAEQPMLHTSPYQQASDAVQLLTVYKAKGLEYEHVFLLACQDEVWGGSGQSNSNRITLPENLAPIRYSGATEDERLRLLFVALTRAKHGLHLTSHRMNYAGKPTRRLKYFDERDTDDGAVVSHVLPEQFSHVVQREEKAPALELLELNWKQPHFEDISDGALRSLLAERIAKYQLSPTHLNNFTDLVYGGPHSFFFNTILRFPSAPSLSSQFGTAIHETLEWYQHEFTKEGTAPSVESTTTYFTNRMRMRKLVEETLANEIERGTHALEAYIQQRGNIFTPSDRSEVNFMNEGVIIGEAHLSGKIDRLEIDTVTKTITVVDYKTGKSYTKWQKIPKLHKYKQQLYCYKLLVEHSASFAGYRVKSGRLEFVEPDPETGTVGSLELTFTSDEEARVQALLQAVWRHVQSLNFPDVMPYEPTMQGILAFEDDLLSGTI